MTRHVAGGSFWPKNPERPRWDAPEACRHYALGLAVGRNPFYRGRHRFASLAPPPSRAPFTCSRPSTRILNLALVAAHLHSDSRVKPSLGKSVGNERVVRSRAWTTTAPSKQHLEETGPGKKKPYSSYANGVYCRLWVACYHASPGLGLRQHQPSSSWISPWPAGTPAKRSFDDATNKGVIKLLPRKPSAIKQRPGDRRCEIRYIEIRPEFTARLRPRRNLAEPRHHPGMSARLKLSDLMIALGGVDDGGHRGRPSACLQALSKAQRECGQVAPKTPCVGRHQAGGELHDGIKQQGCARRPISIERGLGDARSARHFVEADAAKTSLG